ncbi:hypothetical protein DV515_00017626, partial [Chloebia gouldiae]
MMMMDDGWMAPRSFFPGALTSRSWNAPGSVRTRRWGPNAGVRGVPGAIPVFFLRDAVGMRRGRDPEGAARPSLGWFLPPFLPSAPIWPCKERSAGCPELSQHGAGNVGNVGNLLPLCWAELEPEGARQSPWSCQPRPEAPPRVSPGPGCPQPLRPSRAAVPGRGTGKDPARPEPPPPPPAPRQHIWDTPGAFKAARLSSWPEMKGKLSLGGWNAFPALRSAAAGAHFLRRLSRGTPRHIPGPRGLRAPRGAPGMLRAAARGGKSSSRTSPGRGSGCRADASDRFSSFPGGGRPRWGWVSLQLWGFMGFKKRLEAPGISRLQNGELDFGGLDGALSIPGLLLSRFSKGLIPLHQGRGIPQLLTPSSTRNKRVFSRLEKENVPVLWEGLVEFRVSRGLEGMDLGVYQPIKGVKPLKRMGRRSSLPLVIIPAHSPPVTLPWDPSSPAPGWEGAEGPPEGPGPPDDPFALAPSGSPQTPSPSRRLFPAVPAWGSSASSIVLKITIPSSVCDVLPPLPAPGSVPAPPAPVSSSRHQNCSVGDLQFGCFSPKAWLEHEDSLGNGSRTGLVSVCPAGHSPWEPGHSFGIPGSSPISSSGTLPDAQDAVSEVEFGGFSDFSQLGNKGQTQAGPAPCPGSRDSTCGDTPVSGKVWDTLPSVPVHLTLLPPLPGSGTGFQGKHSPGNRDLQAQTPLQVPQVPPGLSPSPDPPAGPSGSVPKPRPPCRSLRSVCPQAQTPLQVPPGLSPSPDPPAGPSGLSPGPDPPAGPSGPSGLSPSPDPPAGPSGLSPSPDPPAGPACPQGQHHPLEAPGPLPELRDTPRATLGTPSRDLCPQHLPPPKPPGGSPAPRGSSGAFEAPLPPSPHLESRLGKCKKSALFLRVPLNPSTGRKSAKTPQRVPVRAVGVLHDPKHSPKSSRGSPIPEDSSGCPVLGSEECCSGKSGQFHEKWGWERLVQPENGVRRLGLCGGWRGDGFESPGKPLEHQDLCALLSQCQGTGIPAGILPPEPRAGSLWGLRSPLQGRAELC